MMQLPQATIAEMGKNILLGIGNRYDSNLQFVVAEITRRYGSMFLGGLRVSSA